MPGTINAAYMGGGVFVDVCGMGTSLLTTSMVTKVNSLVIVGKATSEASWWGYGRVGARAGDAIRAPEPGARAYAFAWRPLVVAF